MDRSDGHVVDDDDNDDHDDDDDAFNLLFLLYLSHCDCLIICILFRKETKPMASEMPTFYRFQSFLNDFIKSISAFNFNVDFR